MLPMGGITGVPDAIDASIENQYGGNLHAHVRVFIQRVHQHHTLAACINEVEKQWPAFEERIHDAMGAMPSFVAKDNSPALGSSNGTNGAALNVNFLHVLNVEGVQRKA